MFAEHGGDVQRAARHWGIPPAQWLDLSTGINPLGWPVPAIPARHWHDLPQHNETLLQAARDYYACASVLPVAGSQAAIQGLPRLRHDRHGPGRVGILAPTFSEHARNWQQAGHSVIPVTSANLEARLPRLDVLVLVNPNNPTAEAFAAEQLLDWHSQLVSRGGWLIVDEAFMDCTPEHSLAAHTQRPGLIVLRSLGKFWGLAGARVGFVLAEAEWLETLASMMGPWSLSGPSVHVASQALADVDWQTAMRNRLAVEAEKLVNLLNRHGLMVAGQTPLFAWVPHADCLALFEAFAALGILIRVFPAAPDAMGSLRFGLPGDDQDWQRLAAALSVIMA